MKPAVMMNPARVALTGQAVAPGTVRRHDAAGPGKDRPPVETLSSATRTRYKIESANPGRSAANILFVMTWFKREKKPIEATGRAARRY